MFLQTTIGRLQMGPALSIQRLRALSVSAAMTFAMGAGARAAEVNFSQLPTANQSDLPSNHHFGQTLENVVQADDFVSDGRAISTVRWWGSNMVCPLGPLYGMDPGASDLTRSPVLLTVNAGTGQATPVAGNVCVGGTNPGTPCPTGTECVPGGPLACRGGVGHAQGTISEIEWSPDGNTLYGSSGSPPSLLYEIDPVPSPDPNDPMGSLINASTATGLTYPTCAGCTCQPPTCSGSLNGLEFDQAGVLLGTFKEFPSAGSGPTRLVEVNTTTGALTVRGTTGLTGLTQNLGGLAFNPSFSTLYAITSGNSAIPPRLYTLNPATGLASVSFVKLNDLGVDVTFEASSLEVLENGTLITAGSDGNLYGVDPANGQVTLRGPLGAAAKLSGLSVRPCKAPTIAPLVCGAPCGNGSLNAGEQCEPPNTATCDSCCQIIPPIDGWFVSFHEPLSPGSGAPPEVSLGMYFCDAAVVQNTSESLTACDPHLVRKYAVDLDQCCLIHSGVDSRSGATPAQSTVFDGEECTAYSIGIQAVIGAKFSGVGCGQTSTGNAVTGDFWGWHGSNLEHGLESAVESVVSMDGTDWEYGPWVAATAACGQANLAFELLTDEARPPNLANFDFTVNHAIPDCSFATGPGSWSDAIVIDPLDTERIFDVNVGLRVTHTFVSDLVVTLEHDDGDSLRTVTLMSQVGMAETDPFNQCDCCGLSSSNVNVTFDDLGTNSIETATGLSGSFQPDAGATGWPGRLSTFTGMKRGGDWTLTVYDSGFDDEGTLDSWSLRFVKPGLMDCNNNGLSDDCDIESGLSTDSNANTVPMSNLIPDECDWPQCRYLSFVPAGVGPAKAIRVRLTNLPGFPAFNGQDRWVGAPQTACEEAGRALPPCANDLQIFATAPVECDPYIGDWSGIKALHVFGNAIVPLSTYTISVCDTKTSGACPTLAMITTGRWGDIRDPFNVVNFQDVSILVDKFKDLPRAPVKARSDILGAVPNRIVNFMEVSAAVSAFQGNPYPPSFVPSTCPP